MSRTIAPDAAEHRGFSERGRKVGYPQMSPTWIWMQIAIVVFVVIGMVVAITKLA
jgi:energy-coupling factor transporter transmembrane protein EcfT